MTAKELIKELAGLENQDADIAIENLTTLKSYLASMQYAIDKAEYGSDYEDGYFYRKARKGC